VLRFALRRALWTLPTLVAITLIAFGFLSVIPRRDTASARLTPVASQEQTLPLFLNPNPRDVRSLAESAVADIGRGTDPLAAGRLARLGGAALPFVLPRFDELAPDHRARVASALAPAAIRMRLLRSEAFRDPAEAVLFWSSFWEERSVDFKTSVVRRAVRRLAIADSDARRSELIELDTFALEEILAAVGQIRTPDDVARASRLLDIASHVTGRDDRVAPNAPLRDAARCAVRWNQWWLTSRADYVVLTGPARLTATIIETRYGHWALEAGSLRLGMGFDGVPVLNKLRRRGPRTLVLIAAAELMAVTSGIGLGLLSAIRRGKRGERFPTLAALASHSLTALIIGAVIAVAASTRLALAAAMLALALSTIAPTARHSRLAAFEAAASEFVRAARARGAGPWRIAFGHLLRPAAVAAIAVASIDFPIALTGACVVERLFSLRGLGTDLTAAVLVRDIPFLMAFAVVGAAVSALMMLAGDLAHAWLDPKSRARLLGDLP